MKNLQIIGHLGKDAEVVQNDNSQYTTVFFSVAHSETFKDENGNEKTHTDWISCFKKYKNDPSRVLQVLKKGLKVYVDGSPNFKLQTSQAGGVFVNITLNVRNMEFMSKKD